MESFGNCFKSLKIVKNKQTKQEVLILVLWKV